MKVFLVVAGTIGLLTSSVALADASLLKNSDFSQLDAHGQPVGWTCVCQEQLAACNVGTESNSTRFITLQPGCVLISGRVEFSNPSDGLKMQLTVAGNSAHFQDFRLLTRSNSGIFGSLETGHPSTIIPTQEGSVLLSPPISSAGASYVALQIDNTQNTPLVIRKADIIEGGLAPEPKTAALLKATHLTVFQIAPNSTVKQIWMPLPLDYASQVPLWIQLSPEPASIVESVSYSQDAIGNWGSVVTLKDGVPAGRRFTSNGKGLC